MLLQPNHNKFGLYKEKTGLKLLPPQKGLICNLDMENIVGTTVYDRTGNGNDFTNYNSPLFISGVKGLNRGLSYNGTNQYSNGSNFSLFDYDTFTLEYFVYYETGKILACQCGSSSSTANQNNSFLVQIFNDQLAVRTVVNGVAYPIVHNVSPNKYYHIVYQMVNRNTLRLYVDGEFISEISAVYPNENASGYRSIDISSVYRFGASRIYYNGNCLLLRVWNRALTDKEITYLYNDGYGIK